MVGKGSPTVFSDAGRLNMVPDPMVQVVPGCLADIEDLPFRGTKKIHAALAPNTIARDQHSRVGWVRPVADGGTGVTKGEFYCDPVQYSRHGLGKIIYQGECFFKVHFPPPFAIRLGQHWHNSFGVRLLPPETSATGWLPPVARPRLPYLWLTSRIGLRLSDRATRNSSKGA